MQQKLVLENRSVRRRTAAVTHLLSTFLPHSLSPKNSTPLTTTQCQSCLKVHLLYITSRSMKKSASVGTIFFETSFTCENSQLLYSMRTLWPEDDSGAGQLCCFIKSVLVFIELMKYVYHFFFFLVDDCRLWLKCLPGQGHLSELSPEWVL